MGDQGRTPESLVGRTKREEQGEVTEKYSAKGPGMPLKQNKTTQQ